ncbi:MAG: type II secretion system protein [Candidatus Saccharimonadales bacterium]
MLGNWLKNRYKTNDRSGFTIIEILVVLVIIGILVVLIVSTHAGIARNNRNVERQNDIQNIYKQMEAFYVNNSEYPTLADMNNPAWIKNNLPNLNRQVLRDPSSSSYKLVAGPQPRAYAYDVRAKDGSPCNNIKKICFHYTLTATLEAGAVHKTFTKSSLN